MDNQVSKSIERKIQESINNHKWSEAYQYCLEVLKYDPTNSQFIKLKKKIEKKVQKTNKKAVLNDLKKLAYLFTEGKYEEYLNELKKLQIFIPHFPPVIKEISKVQSTLKEKYQEKQRHFFQEKLVEIEALEQKKEYSKALEICKKLNELGFNKEKNNRQIQKLKQKWINNELESQSELLKSKKFEEILNFYFKIQLIDTNNQFIKKSIKKIEGKYLHHQKNDKKNHIQQNLHEIKTLYKSKEYEKGLKLALMTLEMDPQNNKAFHYKNIIQKRIEKKAQKELNQQIKESFEEMGKQYQVNKGNFIRI